VIRQASQMRVICLSKNSFSKTIWTFPETDAIEGPNGARKLIKVSSINLWSIICWSANCEIAFAPRLSDSDRASRNVKHQKHHIGQARFPIV
jgi:hypothetical protein